LGREGRWEGEGIRQQAKDSERQIKRKEKKQLPLSDKKQAEDGRRERERERA